MVLIQILAVAVIVLCSNWLDAVSYRRLYWADWNRDGPKIEMSNMDGTERTVLVKDDLGLPNGLTFDPDNQLLCWADAGETVTLILMPQSSHSPTQFHSELIFLDLFLVQVFSRSFVPHWRFVDLQVLVSWSVWILTAGSGGTSLMGSSIPSLSSPMEEISITPTGEGTDLQTHTNTVYSNSND